MRLRIAETKYGTYQAADSNAGYSLFRGIAYAKPPIGERRWKAPEDPEPFEGVKVCDTFGPACVQYDRWSDAIDDVTNSDEHPYILIPNYPYPPKMSEDCLYLNIYTPAETKEEKLPVLFYIHGGGCQQWYGSDYEYCGDAFCSKGCIVVSITYRLNVFGFFAHPELAKESSSGTSGNYGLMDQIQALKWVYENVEAFGGDPKNITVFGQSSGGRSTLSLLCSPLTKGMIRHVSIQSAGGLGRFMEERNRDEMEQLGQEFMEMTGCRNINEMRQLDSDTLRITNDRLGFMRGFNIYTDGYVLTDNIDTCIREDLLPDDVDIIIGCTADEGANSKPAFMGMDMYGQIRDLCEVYDKNKHKNIYMYVFNQEQPGDDAGVPHSCDNRYQFKTLDGCWRPYTEEDYDLSEQMNQYWANFAMTGDPNSDGLPCWEPYNTNGRAMWFNGKGSQMK
ncbi:MAG: carboxylesterase family protein [Erysipelotrichaceae bacterium]|nr:carboxylesterase family protein [Erysipelotrichaceae bacterium]